MHSLVNSLYFIGCLRYCYDLIGSLITKITIWAVRFTIQVAKSEFFYSLVFTPYSVFHLCYYYNLNLFWGNRKNTNLKTVNKNTNLKKEEVLVSRQPKKDIDFKSKKKNSNLKSVENSTKLEEKVEKKVLISR